MKVLGHQLRTVDQQVRARARRSGCGVAARRRPARGSASRSGSWCRGSSTRRCSTPAWSARRSATPGARDRARRSRDRSARAGTPPAARTAAGSRGTSHARARSSSCAPCIVVTTLSPSRNSVSSEYITALCASVVLRYDRDAAAAGRVHEAGDVVVGRLEPLGRALRCARLAAVHVLVLRRERCGTAPAARAAAVCWRRCW